MSKGEQPLLASPLWDCLQADVQRFGIVNLVESGTGPRSSGLEAARRLGLRGFSCDVFGPCVHRAAQLYPEFEVHHSDSESMFRILLPRLDGPTFFWLDGHCPTDPACAPGGIFPPYEELLLIKRLKTNYARDVMWLDDVAMIDVPGNPLRAAWDVSLAGVRWTGAKEHTWDEYMAVLDDTHEASVEFGELLTYYPLGLK